MKFEQAIKIASEDKTITLLIDNGVSYGNLHDFLMNVKGIVVDNISKAHAEEKAAAEKIKEADAKKAEEAKKDEVPKETK